MYADSFPRQLSGEYITGICGNQHNHGEVWMWTADTRKALRWNRQGLYIAGFLMGGMLEVLKRFLGFAGTKDSIAGGNRLLPCVCCCSSAISGMEKKKQDPLPGKTAMEGQLQR